MLVVSLHLPHPQPHPRALVASACTSCACLCSGGGGGVSLLASELGPLPRPPRKAASQATPASQPSKRPLSQATPALQAIFQALEVVRQRPWYRECGTTVLLYRGAWKVRTLGSRGRAARKDCLGGLPAQWTVQCCPVRRPLQALVARFEACPIGAAGMAPGPVEVSAQVEASRAARSGSAGSTQGTGVPAARQEWAAENTASWCPPPPHPPPPPPPPAELPGVQHASPEAQRVAPVAHPRPPVFKRFQAAAAALQACSLAPATTPAGAPLLPLLPATPVRSGSHLRWTWPSPWARQSCSRS